MKNKTPSIKPNVASEGEMLLENQLWRNGRDQTTTVRYPETTPFQRQTPNLFTSNSRECRYTVGEIMAGIFHSQISFNEHASLKKKIRGGRKRATWKRTTSITLLGLPWVNVFRHAPRENSTRSHVFLLLRSQGPWRSQIWIPDTRHVLEAVFNLPCLIDGSLWLQIFHLSL